MPHQPARRRLIRGTSAALLGSLNAPGGIGRSWAQGAPEVARIVTGFPPGGTSDVLCRRLAEGLRGLYARSVTVDNKPGAGGQLAIEQMKIAAGDGSVLLQTPASMLMIYPHVYRKLNYDPFTDVTPVAMAANFCFGLAVGPAVPESVRSIEEFVRWARANPDQATFGTPGAGSVPHFLPELLARAARMELRHVPFRGSQAAILDLIGGQIAAVSAPEGEFFQHAKAGKIRLLATSGASRSRFTPETATFAEQGYPSVVYREWFGIFLPARANADTLARANAAIGKALASQPVIDGIAAMGLEPAYSSPGDLAQTLRQDHERWGKVVRQIGFSADS